MPSHPRCGTDRVAASELEVRSRSVDPLFRDDEVADDRGVRLVGVVELQVVAVPADVRLLSAGHDRTGLDHALGSGDQEDHGDCAVDDQVLVDIDRDLPLGEADSLAERVARVADLHLCENRYSSFAHSMASKPLLGCDDAIFT